MSERIELSGLNVAVELQHFIETQALPGTGVEPSAFWSGLADIVAKLGPKKRSSAKKAR
jgi:malate synthase